MDFKVKLTITIGMLKHSFYGLVLLTTPLFGYAPESYDNLHARVVNLTEDVQCLRQQIGQTNAAMEELQANQRMMQKHVDECIATVKAVTPQLNTLAANRDALYLKQKREILAEVAKQLDSLLEKLEKQNQRTLQTLSKTTSSTTPHANTAKTNFSNDYPKNGVVYTVQKGDSLSLIAQKHGATIKDIQNANHIVNPTDLQAGQTLFIPQKN